MAEIEKPTQVDLAVVLGYIAIKDLPTNEKKIRVGLDWFVDLFFPRDITRLSSVFEEKRTTSKN